MHKSCQSILWNIVGRILRANLKKAKCKFVIVTFDGLNTLYSRRLIIHNCQINFYPFCDRTVSKFEDKNLSDKFSADMKFHKIGPT
jgi:hypothetical protein